jgi:hypothetical protein
MPGIVPRARLLAHSPSLRFHLFLLHCRHRIRELGNAYLNFISIGHIIASETEEEIFRTLGTSHHYICIFLCDLRGLSARGVRACQLSPLGALGA